jgi:hypothetical protein
VFTVPAFEVNRESVYLNGLRLTRNLDYTVGVGSGSTDYTLIELSAVKFPGGIELDSDVLEVVTENVDPSLSLILSKLESISTATYGSWNWNKITNLLTMYDEDGNPSLIFEVNDSSDSASRERRQDLEA